MPMSVRQQWLEVAVVMSIGVLPDLYRSTIVALGLQVVTETFAESVSFLLLRSLWVCVPVLYLIRRSGTRVAEFGLVRPRWADLPIAAMVVAGNLAAGSVVWQFLTSMPGGEFATTGDSQGFAGPEGAFDHAMLTAISLANGFAEELVVRAYLITRLRQLWGPVRAVVVSTLLFASYHTYQGSAATLMIGAGGLVFAAAFLAFPRLTPVALAHAALDFYSFASIP